MIKYFISYAYRKRFGTRGLGSTMIGMSEPINEYNFDYVVQHLKKTLGVKKLAVMYYREV